MGFRCFLPWGSSTACVSTLSQQTREFLPCNHLEHLCTVNILTTRLLDHLKWRLVPEQVGNVMTHVIWPIRKPCLLYIADYAHMFNVLSSISQTIKRHSVDMLILLVYRTKNEQKLNMPKQLIVHWHSFTSLNKNYSMTRHINDIQFKKGSL